MKLNPGNVLLKIHRKKRNIILPDEDINVNSESIASDYAEIVAVGPDIKDLKPGDIVLDFGSVKGFEYNDEFYGVALRLMLTLAVDKDNFDLKRKTKDDDKKVDI